jgi:hypothetical protein
MFNKFFFENLTLFEVMSKKNVKPDRPQITISRMRIAFWTTG